MSKKTIFYDSHLKLNAKMIEFGEWLMPLHYGSVVKEHLMVREHCGIFDCSHMAEIIISGKGASTFFNQVVASDLSKLALGSAVYTLFLNESGFVLDDVIVYRLEEEKFFVVVNAVNRKKIFQWIEVKLEEQNISDTLEIMVEDKSDDYALLALQGKQADNIINQYFPDFCDTVKSFQYKRCVYEGISMMVSRTGYTGEPGVEIFIDVAEDSANKKAIQLFEELANTEGVTACGLGARDSLRVEKGYSLYGHEINETIHAIEAGLKRLISWDKKVCIGRDALISYNKQDLTIKLVGLELLEKGIPRTGDMLISNDGIVGDLLHDGAIGNVTSGVYSPVLKKGIALGFISSKYNLDDVIKIQSGDKCLKTKVVSKKFL